jgi:hypothetical protein
VYFSHRLVKGIISGQKQSSISSAWIKRDETKIIDLELVIDPAYLVDGNKSQIAFQISLFKIKKKSIKLKLKTYKALSSIIYIIISIYQNRKKNLTRLYN